MMNATTEATKLNFMTDQGSTRARVSIACRLAGLRTWGPRAWGPRVPAGWPFEPRRCQAEATELARPVAAPATPAAAPVTAEAALGNDPLLAEWPPSGLAGAGERFPADSSERGAYEYDPPPGGDDGAAAGLAGAGGAAEAGGTVGAAVADAGLDTDGVNDGLRPLLTADVSAAAVPAGAAGASAAALSAATAFALPSAAPGFALPMVSAGSGAGIADLVVPVASLAAGAASPGGVSSMAPPSR